jgi:hypothetical protein
MKHIHMENIYFLRNSEKDAKRFYLVTVILLFSLSVSLAQTQTIPTNSFIVNMGVSPQTVANGLKPYGMIYDLMLNYKVPVYWVINTDKGKDGIDFSYGGIDFKGGPFIIDVKYRTSAVNTRIAYWQGQGVVGVTNTADVNNVPVYTTLLATPRWSLDQQNGSIALPFFTNSGIPPEAHGGGTPAVWDTPAQLNCCDDIFIMPHADPTWATHQRLYTWNAECKGAIWLGCHAGSALEDMFDNTTLDGDPINFDEQTNFLSEKTSPASGTGPYYQNALVLWGNHSGGTLPPPYSYDFAGEPIMQFLGTIDAATQNGSEQIYLPVVSWRGTTKIGVWDATQVDVPGKSPGKAAVLAWGPGLGDPNRGKVMLEASHSIAKATAPANIAAQRAFFNFAFLTTNERAVIPDISSVPVTYNSGTNAVLSYSLPSGAPAGTYSATWSSSCGGSFSPNPSTGTSTTFTPPVVTSLTNCVISLEITDGCGRKTFDSKSVVVNPCTLTVGTTVTPVTCYSLANGSIAMAISGGTSPYSWTWTGPSSGSGNGPSPATISGLFAGTYTMGINSANGCTKTITVLVTQPNLLTAPASVTNVACFGGNTGAINLTATGGTTPYNYDWSHISGTNNSEDIAGLYSGTYTVTVTDSRTCSSTVSAYVGQPSGPLSVDGATTSVTCFGSSTGSITVTVTGGTGTKTYNWGGGVTTKDRDNLAAGTYNVIVTDANGCTATKSFTVKSPLRLTVTPTVINASCPGYYDGSITLSVSGGTTDYSYDWSDLDPAHDNVSGRSGLAAGTYTVLVTDSKNCTASLTVTVSNQNPSPQKPTGIQH